jgi:hypothetical protein
MRLQAHGQQHVMGREHQLNVPPQWTPFCPQTVSVCSAWLSQ